MDRKALIKNLLLAFLPILIFVAADEYLSQHFPERQATQYALILAICIGVIQAGYVYGKEKRLDKMTLLDTALIVVLGGISLLSGNDLFFKVKPALVQFIMVVVLAVMAFLKPEMLCAMSGRFMKGLPIEQVQLKAMQRASQAMVIVLLLHTILIVYAALYMSRAAWAFISGPLIYIVAGVYFGIMLLVRKLRS